MGRPKKQVIIEEEHVTETPHILKDPLYNCGECKGEGMIFNSANPQGIICQRCKGTGKV